MKKSKKRGRLGVPIPDRRFWIRDIKEKYEKNKVVSGMKPTGHYWFKLGKFLQDNETKPVLVNSHHVKKSKELDDKGDARKLYLASYGNC